jgi:hypothetical protein
MNSVKGLMEVLQDIYDQCLGDEIVNEFTIKIYDDRKGKYVTLTCSKEGFDYEWDT